MAEPAGVVVSRRDLCARCISWDFEDLFFEYHNGRGFPTPFEQCGYPYDLDRRKFEEVSSNTRNCALCHLILEVISSNEAWNVARSQTSHLSIDFRAETFGFRRMISADGRPGRVEMLLRLMLIPVDEKNPMQAGYHPTKIDFPKLQLPYRLTLDGQIGLRESREWRRLGDVVSVEKIKGWIENCQAHLECCADVHSDTPSSDIRLIDVKAKCVVPQSINAKFAALSYVWGPATLQTLRLTEATLRDLSCHNALSDKHELIPKTIRDAMVLCEQLDIQYLWVDSLCIVQDTADFDTNLRMMDRIYQHAHLTIVAVSGKNCQAGLPGVGSRSRKVQWPSINIDGLRFGQDLPSFRDVLNSSPWSRRAWTFQEMLFSRRMLIVSESQAFFLCHATFHWEASADDPIVSKRFLPFFTIDGDQIMQSRRSLRSSLLDNEFPKALQKYWALMLEFRGRDFTFRDDVIRAFSGIMESFEKQFGGQGMWFGLPLACFTEALLLNSHQCIRVPEFPSWSWAGWGDYRGYDEVNRCGRRPVAVTRFYRVEPRFLNLFDEHENLHDVINNAEVVIVPVMTSQEAGVQDIKCLTTISHKVIDIASGHLDPRRLSSLLIFQTLTGWLHMGIDDSEEHEPEKSFDFQHGMVVGCITSPSFGEPSPSHLPEEPPYFPREWFARQKRPEDPKLSHLRVLEFAVIARDWKNVVHLMLLETDARGVSTLVSLCLVSDFLWNSADLTERTVYLV